MAPTYELIASNTLTTTAASVTFSAIPATYTDLVVKLSGRLATSGRKDLRFYFNANNTDNSYTYLRGSGSAASSARGGTILVNNDTVPSTTETADTFNNVEIYIPNYLSLTNKPVSAFGVMETNATAAYITATAGLDVAVSPAAITSITLYPSSGSWVSGSSFFLYGIKSA